MIIVLRPTASASSIAEIQAWFADQDVEVRRLDTSERTLLITSSQWGGDSSYLSNRTEIVEALIDTGTEYQLCSRSYQLENTVVDLGDDIVFGRDHTVLMAGPCAIESEDQVIHAAEFLRHNFDIKVFRAGAFKPRTSPYTFQGLADKGLRLLEKVRDEFGMKIITEVKDTTHLDAVAEVADIVQIGTKSMYNFSLLQSCGRLDKPILLKRGFMSTINEFLRAADFILSSGNPHVILCERGIRTFESQIRFSMDICSAALIQEISHLPIVLDPSHAIGIASYVPKVAQAAAGLGVDGLLIEVHPHPALAKSDKDQALSFDQFSEMVPMLARICSAVGRKLV